MTSQNKLRRLPGITHVSFDKDGVLMDVQHYWVSVIIARSDRIRAMAGLSDELPGKLSQAMGVDPVARRIIDGGPVGYRSRPDVAEGAARLLAVETNAGFDETWVLERFDEVDAITESMLDQWCRPIQGIHRVIRSLADDGFNLSIVTSDRTELARKTMELFGIADCFQSVVGGDRAPAQKPDPAGLLQACVEVGAAPEHTAYIGDTEVDMRAARAGGCVAVGVLSGLGAGSAFAASADLLLTGIDELLPDGEHFDVLSR